MERLMASYSIEHVYYIRAQDTYLVGPYSHSIEAYYQLAFNKTYLGFNTPNSLSFVVITNKVIREHTSMGSTIEIVLLNR